MNLNNLVVYYIGKHFNDNNVMSVEDFDRILLRVERENKRVVKR